LTWIKCAQTGRRHEPAPGIGGRGRLYRTDTANLFGGTTFWHAHELRESPDTSACNSASAYAKPE
jgi:hypothetical protein